MLKAWVLPICQVTITVTFLSHRIGLSDLCAAVAGGHLSYQAPCMTIQGSSLKEQQGIISQSLKHHAQTWAPNWRWLSFGNIHNSRETLTFTTPEFPLILLAPRLGLCVPVWVCMWVHMFFPGNSVNTTGLITGNYHYISQVMAMRENGLLGWLELGMQKLNKHCFFVFKGSLSSI